MMISITGTYTLDLCYTSHGYQDSFLLRSRYLRCLYILRNPLAPINIPNYAGSVCTTILLMTHVCHVMSCHVLNRYMSCCII